MYFYVYFHDFLNHVTYSIRFFYHIKIKWRYDYELEFPKKVSMIKILPHPTYAALPFKKYFY